MQFFTPHYLCRSPYGGDLVRQLRVNIPLKPLPLALDPFPDLRCLWHNPFPVKETNKSLLNARGPLAAPLSQISFFLFSGLSLSMLNWCCLMAGCLGRQVSPSCPTRGGGEDAQAPKGSKRAWWDIKIKTCKFLSCPPRQGHPRLVCPQPSGSTHSVTLTGQGC